MATLSTALYSAQAETPVRANTTRMADANLASGDVQFAHFSYTLLGTEASADVLQLCELPAGAIPLPQLSKVSCLASPGTTLTMNIGNTGTPAGWANALALGGSAQDKLCTAGGTMPAWIAATPLVADSNSGNAKIQAVLSTVASAAAGVILQFMLAYKQNR